MRDLPAGFAVPVFRSLCQPILIAGVKREFALALWLGVGLCVANGGFWRVWWTIPVAFLVHVGVAYGTRHDPDFLEVARRRLRSPQRLSP